MNVIIPVAGEGVRLRPHTNIIPKSLLYVAGKPILGHILDSLKPLNISKLVLIIGAKGEAIVQYCKNYSHNFKFVKQEKRLGLGHAIYLGAKCLKGATMVLLGDTIIDCNFKKITVKPTNILAVKEVTEPRRFGIVEVAGNNVLDVVEKPDIPKSNLAIVGLYYFKEIEKLSYAIAYNMKKGIKTKGEYQLTDGLRHLIKKGEKFKIVTIDNWFDCGTSESLIETNQHLLKNNHHYKKRKGVLIIAPVYIPNSVEISNSIVGPNVSIGENVVIKDSIIKDSIINRGAFVENGILSKSIIGERAVVKSGFKKLNVGDSSIIEFP